MINSALINVMSAAAIKAGRGLMRDFGEVDQLQISRKSASNFVTNADVRTEKLLRGELAKARPEYGFLLEEGGEVAGSDGMHRWIIDPLDGTSNFIHAIPYFCISIGLEKKTGDKSEIIAGVIFDPIHNELFAAEKGRGAFVNSRRIAVSTRDQFDAAMLVTGKIPHGANTTLMQSGGTLRCFGATALDLAHLAAGRIDACFYHSIQPWDIAAGILIVQEAGGMMCDLSGKEASAYSPTLLAANPPLSTALRKVLVKAA